MPEPGSFALKGLSRSLAVRFKAGRGPELTEDPLRRLQPSQRAVWETLRHRYGDIRLRPVQAGGASGPVKTILERVRARRPEFPAPDIAERYFVDFREPAAVHEGRAAFLTWDDIQDAEVVPPVSLPMGGADEPSYGRQTYLHKPPFGVRAKSVWALAGGDGAGVRLADVEGGWDLHHPDLAGLAAKLIFGDEADPDDNSDVDAATLVEHGTAVLGLVAAAHDGAYVAGLSPAVSVLLSSFRRKTVQNGETTWYDAVPDAIAEAVVTLGEGDVLLLELEAGLVNDANGNQVRNLPIEVRSDVFWLLEAATILGITVVEPAGNGANDLDAFVNESGDAVFAAGASDSGAIMVAASYWQKDLAVHEACGMKNVVSWGTNYGKRLNCFAPGHRVATLSWRDVNLERPDFGGTSAASAIIAGACAAIQGARLGKTGVPLSPGELRDLFSSNKGTAPSQNWLGLMGYMPDLEEVLSSFVV